MLLFDLGNLRQLFSRTGWDFTNQISHKYGAVVKLYGMLGVWHIAHT